MHLSSGEASWATTERKQRPRAVAVRPACRSLALEWQQVCQKANMGALEAALAEGSTESPSSRKDLPAAALPAQRFARRPPEGGSAQPMGRRAGPAAEEGAPPSAAFPILPASSAPARTPARVTQRRRTTGARPRRQRRGRDAALYLLLVPGPRLQGC